MNLKFKPFFILSLLLFSTSVFSDTRFGISVGNVIVNEPEIGNTMNIGILASSPISDMSGSQATVEFGYSFSLLEADTTAPGTDYGYRVLSIGIAYETEGDFFVKPEIGFESVEEYLSNGYSETTFNKSGTYFSIGFGFRFYDGGTGILKFRKLATETDGFMWSYEALFDL